MRTVVCTLLSALLSACSDPPPGLPRLAEDAVILSFGDSLTHGTGAPSVQSYPTVLAKLIGRTVIRSGVPGELSGAGRARLSTDLARHRPTLVILCHGGNDLLRKQSLAALEQNLTSMIEQAHAHGAAVLLLGVPQPAVFGLDSAEVYARVAAATGVPLLADVLPDILADNRLKSDAVHPNARGYAALAAAVDEFLRDSGAVH